MDMETIRQRIRERSIAELSRVTGLSYRALTAIRDGDRKNPRHDTVTAIVDGLRRVKVKPDAPDKLKKA